MPEYRTPSFQSNRRKLILQVLPLLLIIAITLVGISQLSVVREFFGRAAGEPANIVVDTQAVLGPMPRPWRNLAQGGEGFDWRIGALTGPVRALHPEYIRLDHIYDFYDIVKGTPGNLTFDFSKFDQVLNDIQAVGAKPYISLSYMPPVIAVNGELVGKPISWTDWQLVVQKTIEHVSGTRRTADVYYEVWNEPDLFGGWKYYGDKNYITLYNYAAQGSANARGTLPYKFGGPGITALYKSWFDAMAKNAINNKVRMDFFSWHRYNLDIDQYKKDMTEARNWLAAYPQLEPTVELHITEWGHDSNNNVGYDGNLGAAHTVAGGIEMIGVVNRAFVFEIQDGKDPAGKSRWGRWGLFDYAGQAKPRYNALRMLDKIGNQRLQLLGKGSWVKAVAARGDTGSTQVVLANYDKYGSHSENVPVTFTNITPGSYTVNQEFLGGRRFTQNVATDAAALKVQVSMPANSVSFVELTSATPTAPAAVPAQ